MAVTFFNGERNDSKYESREPSRPSTRSEPSGSLWRIANEMVRNETGANSPGKVQMFVRAATRRSHSACPAAGSAV